MPEDVEHAAGREGLNRREQFNEWNRDPDFWRDVYGKVLSALIIAVIGYGIGVASGYIRPRQREFFGVVGSVLALVGS